VLWRIWPCCHAGKGLGIAGYVRVMTAVSGAITAVRMQLLGRNPLFSRSSALQALFGEVFEGNTVDVRLYRKLRRR